MARDYAAVPHEYREEMSDLSDAEFGRLMRALLLYSETGEPMALRGNERFHAKRVMAEEDRHRRSYDELVSARSRAGKASAEARQQRSTDGSKSRNSESDPETEPKQKGPFSYEKRPARAYAAPQKRDKNSWMDEVITARGSEGKDRQASPASRNRDHSWMKDYD